MVATRIDIAQYTNTICALSLLISDKCDSDMFYYFGCIALLASITTNFYTYFQYINYEDRAAQIIRWKITISVLFNFVLLGFYIAEVVLI